VHCDGFTDLDRPNFNHYSKAEELKAKALASLQSHGVYPQAICEERSIKLETVGRSASRTLVS
jgi:hypothetical protein